MKSAAPVAFERPGREGWLHPGYPRSLLLGGVFSVAWSPCIGPVLGAVLTMAATSGTAGQGGLLLACYSLGLGIWFLAFGLAFGSLAPRLRRAQRHLPLLMMAAGAVFIVVGALMFLGDFTRLNGEFQSFGFFFGSTSSTEEELSSAADGPAGPLVAFFGGVVSFLSPCMLPMVPVYMASLAGDAFTGSGSAGGDRRRMFLHALAFVVGFTIVFSAIGASVGFAGNAVQQHLDTATRVGGLVLMALGMHMSGLIRIPYLDRTYQLSVR